LMRARLRPKPFHTRLFSQGAPQNGDEENQFRFYEQKEG